MAFYNAAVALPCRWAVWQSSAPCPIGNCVRWSSTPRWGRGLYSTTDLTYIKTKNRSPLKTDFKWSDREQMYPQWIHLPKPATSPMFAWSLQLVWQPCGAVFCRDQTHTSSPHKASTHVCMYVRTGDCHSGIPPSCGCYIAWQITYCCCRNRLGTRLFCVFLPPLVGGVVAYIPCS